MDSIRNVVKRKDFPLVTAVLVAINVIIFIVFEFMGSTQDVDFIFEHGGLSYEKVIYQKEYYRLITHFFIHFGYEHIIFNMFVLGALGYYLENIMNRLVFFLTYMLSGIFAGIVSVVWNYYTEGDVVSAGASGAIYGIMGAMLALIIMNRGRVRNVGPLQLIVFILLTLFCNYGDKQVDNAAHIAGFIFGAVFIYAKERFAKKKI